MLNMAMMNYQTIIIFLAKVMEYILVMLITDSFLPTMLYSIIIKEIRQAIKTVKYIIKFEDQIVTFIAEQEEII